MKGTTIFIRAPNTEGRGYRKAAAIEVNFLWNIFPKDYRPTESTNEEFGRFLQEKHISSIVIMKVSTEKVVILKR